MKLTTNAGTTSPSSLSPLAPPLTSSEPRTPPTVNTATVNLIKEFESFVPSPSPDPIGLPTVGYSHRCRQPNGADVPYPFPLTKATATNLLNSDLHQFAKCVFESINDSVTLNDNQYGALVSFTFNVGNGNFRSSALLRRINNGENPNVVASEELRKWNKARASVLAGLTRRRAAETELFKRAPGV